MYKSFTADDYRKHHKLPTDYTVDGFIIFGTFHPGPYDVLKEELSKIGKEVTYTKTLKGPYFEPIVEFAIDGKTYWFTVAYGGTMLSEWTHLACLFGSKTNVVIGSCGGLFPEADTTQVILPTYAYADESATRMYEPEAKNQHHSSEDLDQRLIKQLSVKHKVWHGPTVTCQAMMAETWDDIQQWSQDGYYGVEMEAATVFAVSNHFKCESAALLVIGDNLVKEHTVMDVNYESGAEVRHDVRRDLLVAALKDLLGL
jgi:purine-nucleoside phosphorylase